MRLFKTKSNDFSMKLKVSSTINVKSKKYCIMVSLHKFSKHVIFSLYFLRDLSIAQPLQPSCSKSLQRNTHHHHILQRSLGLSHQNVDPKKSIQSK